MTNNALLLGGETRPPASGRAPTHLDEAVVLGSSAQQHVARRQLELLANRDTDVLVIGETGTGKEVLARVLHANSSRKIGPFVVLDTTLIGSGRPERGLADALRASEEIMAAQARREAMRSPSSGTIFLACIGRLPALGQGAVLRLLLERLAGHGNGDRPGTGQGPRPGARVIFGASNALLDLARQSDIAPNVREQIQTMLIELAPLRSRREDIPLIVEHLENAIEADLGHVGPRFSAGALSALAELPWQGNLRELFESVRQALVGAKTGVIGPEHLWPNSFVETPRGDAYEVGYAELRRQTLARFEAEFVSSVMKAAGGNVSLAARLGKIDRKHLWRLMQRAHVALQVKGNDFRPPSD